MFDVTQKDVFDSILSSNFPNNPSKQLQMFEKLPLQRKLRSF